MDKYVEELMYDGDSEDINGDEMLDQLNDDSLA